MSKMIFCNFALIILFSGIGFLLLTSRGVEPVHAMACCEELNCDNKRISCVGTCDAAYNPSDENAYQTCLTQCQQDWNTCSLIQCENCDNIGPVPSGICGPYQIFCTTVFCNNDDNFCHIIQWTITSP